MSKRKVHHHVYKSPPLGPYESRTYLAPSFIKVNFNVVFPSMAKSTEWPLTFRHCDWNNVPFFLQSITATLFREW